MDSTLLREAFLARGERHLNAVQSISSEVRKFYELGQPYRVFHGSSNSTRPAHGSQENIVDISMLSNVMGIDVERRLVSLGPNVPMDRLVETTLAYDLVPAVVMEFPGITVGGGFSGTSGESSSFRHGFFNDTIESVELVLGNGEIVLASRDERKDLFEGAAGAAGTLGIVTRVTLRLVEARKYVKTTYCKIDTISDAIAHIQEETQNPDVDYIDGIVYSQKHSVVITGELTDERPADSGPVQTFSNASDPWFYMHVEEHTKDLPDMHAVVEYIPLAEYLFRYDRAGFWVGRQGYTYFKVVPFNRFFRWLLDDYSHTRTLYHAMHASGVASQMVIQDVALPYDTAEAFIGWVDKELGIWPLWLCPLRGGCPQPTFHPVTVGEKSFLMTSLDRLISQPMLSIGVWGWGPPEYSAFMTKNREMESKLVELGGRKWLYARTYYTEDEFWSIYDRPWYEKLRAKYFATTLPSVYDKVKHKLPHDANGRSMFEWKSWLSTWPIGGIYGMVKATFSGDISLHRQAGWRYNGQD